MTYFFFGLLFHATGVIGAAILLHKTKKKN